MESKICHKCGDEKQITLFYKNTMCNDGYRNVCKDCCKLKQNQYRLENHETIIKEKKIYYQKNKEIISEKKKQEWRNNPLHSKSEKEKRAQERHQKSIIRKKKYQKEYRLKRHNSDGLFRLKYSLRRRMKDFISNKTKKTEEILGCSWLEFKIHIEKQFTNGMTWENHGVNGWHLDHIKPLSLAKSEEELYKLNHYSNLQPLWADENIRKSNKII
jgi:hypothetical protein